MAQAPGPQDRSTFLDVYLLEADSEVEKRARRIKRRAILISFLLEILVIVALVLMPLLGKGESIAARIFVPTVPYSPGSAPHTAPQHPGSPVHPVCHFCAPPSIPNVIVTHDPTPSNILDQPPGVDSIPGAPQSDGVIGGNPALQPKTQPRPPAPPATVRRAVSGSVEAALLTHRVEPQYPPLARQLHREGRVELHAIIAADGSIKSLEVISGDPLFFQSAMAAVQEWHYRPTILDGAPIEVDTHITVIYTLAH
jgi:periplasmic protein TonB